MPPAGARSGRLSSVRKWILIVVPTVILLALIVGDQAAKGWAESKLAERAAAYYPPGAGSSASIHSFPFLGRLLVSGSVPRVDVTLDDLHVDPVLIRQLSIHVSAVKLNRSDLFHGRVHLDDVGAGKMVATIDGPARARAAGVERALPGWAARAADGLLAAWGRLTADRRRQVVGEARLAGEAAARRVAGELAELVALDPAEQRATPLEVIRTAVVEPTEVLAAAGMPR